MTNQTSSLQDISPSHNFLAGNEGTHYPLFYTHGPGVIPTDNSQKVLSSEEIKPAEVIKKVYSRNVNNRKGRNIRKY